MDGIGSGLSSLAFFGFIAFLIWHGSREKFEKRRLRLEEQSRILDRIGSGPELTEFLKTAQGKRFLDQLDEANSELSDERQKGREYRMGIIGLLMGGIIVSCVAASFFVLAAYYADQFVIPATIVGAVGLSLLLVAWLQYALGKKWDMFESGSKDVRPRRTLE
jgi:hypothetical protein